VTIIIRQPGTQATIQDLGRPGWQHVGVTVGGAMDQCAHRIANLLVGNDENAAAVECAFAGTAVQFTVPTTFAITGRDVKATLDGVPILPWRATRAERMQLLIVHAGVWSTVALAGGVDVALVLNGRGTALRAGFGGFQGRSLQREDAVPLGAPTPRSMQITDDLNAHRRTSANWGITVIPPYSPSPTIRIISGPELNALTSTSREALLGDSFRVSADSDRMGTRLRGPVLALSSPREMLSSGVTVGTVQLPPDGSPIVLMADRQTTGGYPRLGDVITVDQPLVAQLRPGESLRFSLTSLHEAHREYHAREDSISRAAVALSLRFGAAS
jgi:antagonist of KipI